jgi:hypothetical protein
MWLGYGSSGGRNCTSRVAPRGLLEGFKAVAISVSEPLVEQLTRSEGAALRILAPLIAKKRTFQDS